MPFWMLTEPAGLKRARNHTDRDILLLKEIPAINNNAQAEKINKKNSSQPVEICTN